MTTLDADQTSEAYGMLCDAVARIFFADKFGIEPYQELLGDRLPNTSDWCRRAAKAACDALDLSPVQLTNPTFTEEDIAAMREYRARFPDESI